MDIIFKEDFSEKFLNFLDEKLVKKSNKINKILCIVILVISLLNIFLNLIPYDLNFLFLNYLKDCTYNPIFYILIVMALYLINSDYSNKKYKVIYWILTILTGIYCIFALVSFLGIPIVNGFSSSFQDSGLFLVIFFLYFLTLLLIVLKKYLSFAQILSTVIWVLGFTGGLFYFPAEGDLFSLGLNYLIYVIIIPFLFITIFPDRGITRLFYLNTKGSKFARKIIVIMPLLLAILSVFFVILNKFTHVDLANNSAIISGISISFLFFVMVISTYNFNKIDIQNKEDHKELKIASEEALLLKSDLDSISSISKIAIGNWDLSRYIWSSEIYNILGIDSNDSNLADDLIKHFVVEEDKEKYINEVKNVNNVFDLVIKIKDANDNFKYISIFKVSNIDEFNNIISKTIFVQDVTNNVLRELKLSETATENQILLKEIHHRVKNNFQIINSLLNIQSFKLRDPKLKEIIAESQKRIRTMSLVHEHLYQYESFSDIDVNIYINDLISEINNSYLSKGNINIKTDIMKVSFDLDLLIPLGLIVNELLTNSIKYAFPNGEDGEIFIGLSLENDEFLLIFKDNGIGLSSESSSSNSVGIGTELIQSLIMQIDGIYNIKSDNGTVITINFKNQI